MEHVFHSSGIIFRGGGCFNGSMTYAPTSNAPARNANVEAYINPDPNPNPNRNPNPYPALNQKPNHIPMSLTLSSERYQCRSNCRQSIMSCHRFNSWAHKYPVQYTSRDMINKSLIKVTPQYLHVYRAIIHHLLTDCHTGVRAWTWARWWPGIS